MITVTDATFADAVLACDVPVALDFWAQWCPPCHAIGRTLAELEPEFAGRLVFAKINSDENPMATRTYRVMSLPTLIVFSRGNVIVAQVGSRPKSHLRDMFEAALDKAGVGAAVSQRPQR
jgi:thioredoxin 1